MHDSTFRFFHRATHFSYFWNVEKSTGEFLYWSISSRNRKLEHKTYRLFTTPRFLYTVSVRSQLKTCNVHCRWICKRSRTVSRFWSKMNADSASNGFVPRWKKIFWYLCDGAPLKSDETYWCAQGSVLNGCYCQKSATREVENDLRAQIFFWSRKTYSFIWFYFFCRVGSLQFLASLANVSLTDFKKC